MSRNPKPDIKKAAALKYEADKYSAPKIVGIGEGLVAENMLQTAKESQVPIVEDLELAKSLSKLVIGDEIPEELYYVIAEVLAFITRLDKNAKEKYTLKEIVKGKHA